MPSPSADRSITTVVVCGCAIAMLTFGARAAFGLYLEPISAARGWGREVFSAAIGIQNILWGIGQPVAGILADRFGIRWVLIGGAVFYALGLALVPVSIVRAGHGGRRTIDVQRATLLGARDRRGLELAWPVSVQLPQSRLHSRVRL